MFGLIAASAALICAACVASLLLPRRGAVAFLLAFGLIAQASVVGVLGVAGLLLRDLSPETLLALSVAWLVAIVLSAARAHLSPAHVLDRARRAATSLREAVASPPVALAFVLVVGTLLWRAVLVTRLPIVDYDGWSYHLVFTDVWLQHNALTLVPQRPWTAGYPADSELLTTWLAAFTRTDTWTGLTSLLPIPLAIAAVAGIARSLGADRSWALFAGLVFAMTPALVASAGTTYVDNLSVAAVAATWWLGIRIIRGEHDIAAALVLGIAAGIAAGTKGTNVLLVGPVSLAAAVVLARSSAATASRRRLVCIARPLLAAFIPALLLGGTWYLKNVLVYGNPIYPFAIGPLPGVTTFADFVLNPPELAGRSFLGQLATSWTWDWDIAYYPYNVRPGGLGRAWPALLVAAAGGVVLLARRRQFAPLVFLLLPAAVTLLTMPMAWYARLTLFLPALAVPIAAVALRALPARPAMAGGVLLVAVAATSLVSANVRPNIDIRVATGGRSWPETDAYLAYLAQPSDADRDNVNLRHECAGFDVIPPGARVTPGGFNLLHGVVGPSLDRILTAPLTTESSGADIASAMRASGATWIVTQKSTDIDKLVAASPRLFLAHGDICQDGRLWQLEAG